MSRPFHRNSYLAHSSQLGHSLPRYNSISFSKKSHTKNIKQYKNIKPYYIMETDSAVLPKSGELGRQTSGFRKSKYLTDRLIEQKKASKKTSKQRSSASRHKDGKQSRSKSKQFQIYKGKSMILGKRKDQTSKQKSEKSKSTMRKILPSTKTYSHEKLSKTCKGGFQKSQKKLKKKVKSKGAKWQEILQSYGEYLSVSEIAELRQIETIYFLGKIKQRKNKQMFTVHKNMPKSDRKHHNVSELIEEDQRPFYNQLLSERKQDYQEERVNIPSDDFYRYETGDHIAYRYEIVSSINKGAFGQVLKVFDHKNKELLALKIVKRSPELVPQTLVEISILAHVSQKDKQGLSGIVKVKDFTIFRKHICIIFQLLQYNLYQLIKANSFNGFDQVQIRMFAIQMLNSLNFLRKQKIIHCDLKPENIVMRRQGKMGIKIIDFGTSCFEGKQIYQYLQSRYYRAPQIIVGTGYSYPIDMWSIGCILAQLRLGEPIFAGSSDVEQLTYICNSIGHPNGGDGTHSLAFLHSQEMKELIQNGYISQFRQLDSVQQIKNHQVFSQWKYIRNSMASFQDRISKVSKEDDNKFIKFIERMLTWQPDKRVTPEQALRDPWITDGLSKQMKKMFLALNTDRRKNSKSKSKQSKKDGKGKKGEKSKSKSKSKSKQKSKQKNVSKSKSKQKNNSKGKQKKGSLNKEKRSSKEAYNIKKSPYERYFHTNYSLQKHGVLKAKLKGVMR